MNDRHDLESDGERRYGAERGQSWREDPPAAALRFLYYMKTCRDVKRRGARAGIMTAAVVDAALGCGHDHVRDVRRSARASPARDLRRRLRGVNGIPASLGRGVVPPSHRLHEQPEAISLRHASRGHRRGDAVHGRQDLAGVKRFRQRVEAVRPSLGLEHHQAEERNRRAVDAFDVRAVGTYVPDHDGRKPGRTAIVPPDQTAWQGRSTALGGPEICRGVRRLSRESDSRFHG
jgi:hypothetical protein